MIKCIIRSFALIFFFAVIVCPVAIFVLSVEKSPLVEKGPELSFDNVKRVEQLIRECKPESMNAKQVKKIHVLEDDLNLLLNYGVSQLTDQGHIFPKVIVSDHQIFLRATAKIPASFAGQYINSQIVFKIDNEKLYIDYLGLGKIKIPGEIITPIALFIGRFSLKPRDYDLVEKNINALRSVSIQSKKLSLVYEWDPDSLLTLHESSKSLLVSPAHQEKLIMYTNEVTKIAGILKNHQVKVISLARVIRPLFKLAEKQANISSDPVLENRALLQALSLYALGKGLGYLITEDRIKKVNPKINMQLTLHERDDLAKHFLVSAGLAVSAGSKLSNFVGLAKEVDDSGGGSGFSFADLAADRAGVKLAELSIASASQAEWIQNQMGSIEEESDFMPRIDQLPEGIMALEFKKQYTDFDSSTYTMIDKEISFRIKECRAYQK